VIEALEFNAPTYELRFYKIDIEAMPLLASQIFYYFCCNKNKKHVILM
jgi:hypothetical protein